MKTTLGWICVSILVPLTILAVYQWALALSALFQDRSRKLSSAANRASFLILVPAHDEESTLATTLVSLAKLRYSREKIRVVVAADRCDDGTATIARKHGIICLERLSGPPGKGAVIAWAMDELGEMLPNFDAVVIIDADTMVDPDLLEAFNWGMTLGYEVQQAYNYVSNPWESGFTRVIAVTSVLRNRFFYGGKATLGMTGMLMGTGMCFSRQMLERYGWRAFSVGEDWEYSAYLLLAGEWIYFNRMARVFARESCGFNRAFAQRLRWASGRYAVAAASAWKLFVSGVRLRRPYLIDAGWVLVAPNYSTQATLALFGLFIAWLASVTPVWHFLLPWSLIVLGSLSSYFLLGVAFTEAPARTLGGIALVPLFLPWRICIELLGLLGYGRSRWVPAPRTAKSNRGSNP